MERDRSKWRRRGTAPRSAAPDFWTLWSCWQSRFSKNVLHKSFEMWMFLCDTVIIGTQKFAQFFRTGLCQQVHCDQKWGDIKTSAQRKAIRTCRGDRILQFSQLRSGLPFRGGGLFLTANYEKRTWQYLPDTAVSSKMGDFNTPSVFHFFKRKRRLEICYFKTAAGLLVFCSDV